MHILHVVGARPNFMKVAPVLRAEHDPKSSRPWFIPASITTQYVRHILPAARHAGSRCEPRVGSGSHANQTAEIMTRFEPVVLERKPDMVLVYGDVNSTVAAALVCSKLQVQVGHVEAGLRSFDRTMPEEINRLVPTSWRTSSSRRPKMAT